MILPWYETIFYCVAICCCFSLSLSRSLSLRIGLWNACCYCMSSIWNIVWHFHREKEKEKDQIYNVQWHIFKQKKVSKKKLCSYITRANVHKRIAQANCRLQLKWRCCIQYMHILYFEQKCSQSQFNGEKKVSHDMCHIAIVHTHIPINHHFVLEPVTNFDIVYAFKKTYSFLFFVQQINYTLDYTLTLDLSRFEVVHMKSVDFFRCFCSLVAKFKRTREETETNDKRETRNKRQNVVNTH